MLAARSRTFDHVVELVAIALELFSPLECLNFIRHCGYRVLLKTLSSSFSSVMCVTVQAKGRP